jgi:hypothetical protein
MNIHRLRIAAICALVPAALALGGCQDLATAPGGNPGGTTTDVGNTGNPQEIAAIQQVVEGETYTAPGTVESDIELTNTAAAAPSDVGVVTQAESLLFHRIVLNSTRTRTVNQTGNTATVMISEDRSGMLKIGQRGLGVRLDRPFSDHGTRSATLVKREGRWMVTSSTFLDRASTLVTTPVHIEYVEFTPSSGSPLRFDSPSQLLTRDAWPMVPLRTVSVTVKISGASEAGARVFLHDHYGEDVREHHKLELTRDTVDPTLFHGTWTPNPYDTEHERMWRRLLTVDVFDTTTLSLDAAAVYNAHEWVLPVAFHRSLIGA